MWYSGVLVAYDGSPSSRYALEVGRDMARANPECKLVLATAFNSSISAADDAVSFGEVRQVQGRARFLEAYAAKLEGTVLVRVLEGDSAASLIIQCCEEEDCDVVVMGSRGVGGIKGYLGSVSYAVARDSRRCVLIARGLVE